MSLDFCSSVMSVFHGYGDPYLFSQTEDVEQPVKANQGAVALGHPEAIVRLGVCYERGQWVQKDVSKAVELYQKASILNHPDAIYRLGLCCEIGQVVLKDLAKAGALYQRAARMSHQGAMARLKTDVFRK